jgi:hypothetical protein
MNARVPQLFYYKKIMHELGCVLFQYCSDFYVRVMVYLPAYVRTYNAGLSFALLELLLCCCWGC